MRLRRRKTRSKGNIKKQAPVSEPLNKSVIRAVYEYPKGPGYSSQQMSYYDLRNSKASRLEEAKVFSEDIS